MKAYSSKDSKKKRLFIWKNVFSKNGALCPRYKILILAKSLSTFKIYQTGDKPGFDFAKQIAASSLKEVTSCSSAVVMSLLAIYCWMVLSCLDMNLVLHKHTL